MDAWIYEFMQRYKNERERRIKMNQNEWLGNPIPSARNGMLLIFGKLCYSLFPKKAIRFSGSMFLSSSDILS